MHRILVPATADGLARAVGETYRQYTGFVNARQRWTGHLFQGHFAAVVTRPRIRLRCGKRP